MEFADGSTLKLDGLFVAEGFAGASELATKLQVFGFLKGTVCLPLLGGSLQFHLIRIRTGMTVSTHRTLFSHGMVHCVLGVLYTAWKLYGNMFL